MHMASAAQLDDQLLTFEESRSEGNLHFDKGEYLEAIECYTTCLRVCEKAIIYTNRALCYLKLSRPRSAQEDCDKALRLEPSNIKALYRKALANKVLQRYSATLWDLKAVLSLDPSNVAAHKEYVTVVDMWKKSTHDQRDLQQSGEEFELTVVLSCCSNQTMYKKSLVAGEAPETIGDIKQLIERQYNISASMQTLEYESHIFDDNCLLRSLRIQSGDTVHVKYVSEADCKEVEVMAVWLFEVLYYLMKECVSVDSGMDRTLEFLITLGINTSLPSTKYFEDILDNKCCANMRHFVQHRGLEVLIEVLTLTQIVPWPKRLVKLKLVELASLCVMQKFILHYSPLILECKGLECCISSLQHSRVERHCQIVDAQSPMQHRHDDLLAFVMVRSVVILCGLCEHSDSRLELAVNPSVLQQVLNISMATPSERQMNEVGVLAPQVSVALLLGMSYSVSTHTHLANPVLIEAVMESSRMERPWCKSEYSKNVLLVKYLCSMFLAQLVLLSLKQIPPFLHKSILSFMEEFLFTPRYVEAMMQELKRTFVWTTFIPYVRLLYTPDENICRKQQETELGSALLKLRSLQVVLLGLHSMLTRENHCKVIVEEGLVDYLVCMPSHVPESLILSARGLPQLLSSHGNVPIQPPRLINLAKAKLAKMYFGLEFVLQTPVNEIMNKLSYLYV